MKLVRYNPLNEFVPSTFGSLMENALQNSSSDYFSPETDIVKNEDSFELQIIAPGMEKSDFEINIDKETLTISGERKMDEEINFSKIESRYGKFKRSFKVSDTIDQEKISANYINGILKVTLPIDHKKTEKKVIKIN